MKIRRDHPLIASFFRHHCEVGFSPWLFSARLFGGGKAFKWLVKNNLEFDNVNEQYKVKRPNSLYDKALRRQDVQCQSPTTL